MYLAKIFQPFFHTIFKPVHFIFNLGCIQQEFTNLVKLYFIRQNQNSFQCQNQPLFCLVLKEKFLNSDEKYFFNMNREQNGKIINYNRIVMLKILIFIALTASVINQQCTPIISSGVQTTPIPQLESSAVTLVNNGISQTQYFYNVPLKNTTTASIYQVAVGVTYIQNYFDPSSMDFAVRTAIYPSYFTLIFLISNEASWAAVHIHYLATSREDVRAGNFIADNSQMLVMGTSNTKNIGVSYYFGRRKWNGGSPYTIVYAFLGGIKCKDRFLDLKIESSIANITQSTINVALSLTSQAPVDSLYISYIMYADVNSPVDISVISNLVQSVQKSFLSHKENEFIAIYRINSRNLPTFFSPAPALPTNLNNSNNTLANSTSLGSIAPPLLLTSDPADNIRGPSRLLATLLSQQNLESFTNSFLLQGFVISAKEYFQGPILTESANSITRSGCANFTECVKLGGFFVTLDGEKRCVLCRPNSQFNPTTKTCDCKEGYFPDKNQACISYSSLCQTGDIFINGTCYTPSTSRCKSNEVFNIKTQLCQCRTGFISYIIGGIQKCAAPCTDGLTFDYKKEKCVCRSNQYNTKGSCINCQDDLAQWNPLANQCQCIKGTYSFLGGKCLMCSPYSKYDPIKKVCQCIDGYAGSGIVCRKFQSQPIPVGYTIYFASPIPTN